MKKFYMIAVTYKTEGLFAIVTSVISHIIWAQKKGYIPVVDLKHYQNQYFKNGREYKDNSWEYFFKQPTDYNLENIPEDAEIIISQNHVCPEKKEELWNEDIPQESSCVDPSLQKRKDYYKKYLRFNDEIQQDLDKKIKDITINKGEILGILCRGTDYTQRCSLGENIQPPVKEIIKKAKEVIKTHPQIKQIYIATEDNEIYEIFKKEFGNMLIENTQYKYSYNKKSAKLLSELEIDRKDHKYNLAKEYLFSIYLLSKCKYFIGGKTTGSEWAWILSDNWEYFFIWDLGKYGKRFKDKLFSITTQRRNYKTYKIVKILGITIRTKQK